MPSPDISVILSVYEQPWTLDLALAALARQSPGPAFEIIVCDDGSSPQMLQVCRLYADRLNADIRYVWQPDREYRLARSRNNAIRCAQGDLLVFLDGDIVVKSDFLRQHLAARQGPRDIICGPRKWVWFESSAPVEGKPSPAGASQAPEVSGEFGEVLDRMAEIATDVDGATQLRWSESNLPWMACIGFGFSVPRSESVRFDENFVGWGPDDRELVCRLVHRHGLTVRFRDDIEVFHLEHRQSGDAPFDPIRPASHPGIVRYLKNKLYFRSLYPELDLLPALKGVLRYRLKPGTDTWERIPPNAVEWEWTAEISTAMRDRIETALREAELWLQRHDPPLGESLPTV